MSGVMRGALEPWGVPEKYEPYIYLGVCTLIWLLHNTFIKDGILSTFLPSEVNRAMEIKKRTDKKIDTTAAASGTAFTHSLVILPFCLAEGYRLWQTDPWNGNSPIFDAVGLLMSGYFIWDIIECLINVKHHGVAFLTHGIMSFIGLYTQIASARCRALGHTALLCGSEISTPFLHIRWFLIQGKKTDSFFFRAVNICCIILFIAYRLVFLPLVVFPSFWLDCFVYFDHTMEMSPSRRYSLAVITILWTVLNYYWGYLFISSQVKNWLKGVKTHPSHVPNVSSDTGVESSDAATQTQQGSHARRRTG